MEKLLFEGRDATQLRKNFEGKTDTGSIVMTYLSNMSDIIQDQRDVMLGYLGQLDIIPRVRMAPRQFFISSENVAAQPETASITENYEDTADDNLLPDIQSLTTEQIQEIILNVVSEKTGYPKDMLGLDVDLEADLSIDSIKKMEIIGGLRDCLKFPEDNENMEASFEKTISIKTLKELAAWIEELGQLEGEEGSSGESEQVFSGVKIVAPAAPSGEKSASIVRMVLETAEFPIEKTDEALLSGRSFAVTDDGNGLTSSLTEALEAKGAKASVITGADTDLSGFDGIILINSAASSAHYSIFDLFSMIKQADMKKLQWIFTFDDISAALLQGSDLTDVKRLEGFTGFIKTLAHEYPGKRLGAVSFHTSFDSSTFTDIVMAELTNEKPFPEVFYEGERRFSSLPVIGAGEAAEGEVKGLNIDESANILVLGGAQGITPPLLARLADEYPCHYILVGRSKFDPENGDYKSLKTVDEIRKYLIETEGMKHPKAVETKARQLFKENQIIEAVELIGKTGARVSYHNADVTDSEAFAGFIREMKESYGSIDGVIHAAGVLEDKLFRDKDVESFRRVYSTKVEPLSVILKELPDLKLLVMFSSMSSSFGNAGQIDYAAGNSVLDMVSFVLKQKKPELKAITFNWGPWKGAGMVNAGLENEFRKKGISFLRLDTGSEFFTNELKRDNAPGVLAIAGDPAELAKFIEAALHRAEPEEFDWSDIGEEAV